MPALPDPKLITANGNYFFKPPAADWYRLVVGTKQNQKFGGGTLTVSQDGHAYTDFDAITAKEAKAVFLGTGEMNFVLTGATAPSIEIKIERREYKM